MADPQLIVSLFTPASDLVLTANSTFEALFGRAGNDTIYPDDPAVSRTQIQNIDFVFGDLFDNSTEEFEVIVNITQGNPLTVLQTGPPSVGADRIVLGDKYQPYYSNSGSPVNLLTNNFLGFNEFAVLYDFNPAQDTIQLNGKKKDYLLVEINGLNLQGIEFFGEAIFSLQQGVPDIVAYVISTPEVKLDLDDKYFNFVGNKPQGKPAIKKIGQLGTTAIDLSLGAATDSSGNVYLTGFTNGPLQGTNKGSSDAWVAKYNSNGNKLWGKQIGSSNTDQAYSIVTDNSGNFYVAGATGGNLFSSKKSLESDAWVAKYDSNGNELWGKQFEAGGFANPSFGLDVDEGGNVYLSGLAIKENLRPDIFNFNVQDDSWVTKFDSSGNQQWLTEIRDPSASFPFNITPFFDETYDVTVDKDGNSYATGWTQGLVKESDPSRSLLKYDSWVSKVNPAGKVEWIQQFGSTNQGLEFSWAVDTDSKGNVYATGWTTGDLGTQEGNRRSESYDYDIWIAKFLPNGTMEWAKQIGSKGDDGEYLSDMEIDSKDNIFLTGYTNDKLGKGKIDRTYNAFVAKFDTEGTNKWVQQFGSKSNLDYATGVTVDDFGKLYVTGFTDGVLGTNTTGADAAAVDAWVAQFDIDKGKLKKYTGNSKDIISIADPGPAPMVDISKSFVTDEKLPKGDNRIDYMEGMDTNVNVVDYGQVGSSLGKFFNPDAQNSFSTVFANGVANGDAPFLKNSDLNFLQQAAKA